jgi:hypothetical protein
MIRIKDLLENLKTSLYYQRKLERAQERASLTPDNLFIQVRLGDLLAKLQKKKEAVAIYELAAQQFIQKNLFAHAIALKKIIFRLEPPADSGEQMEILNRLYEQMLVYREKTSKADEALAPPPESPRRQPVEKGRGGLRLEPRAIPDPVA